MLGLHGPSLVAVSRGCDARASHRGGFSFCGAQAIGSMGFSTCGSWAYYSTACGIFLDQELNLCPLCWQIHSQPLGHQGSPIVLLCFFFFFFNSNTFLPILAKAKSFSHVPVFATPWTADYEVPPSMRFSRQEYWSGLPFPSPLAHIGHLVNTCYLTHLTWHWSRE